MVAKFVALNWEVSNKTFEKGLNGKPPKNAIRNRKTGEYIRGEDGAFYTYYPNRLILVLRATNGEVFKEDIMSYVKFVRHDIRVTKRIRQLLEEKFSGMEFEVKKMENGQYLVYRIYDAIEDAIK
jgi:hypothetical protein